MTIAVTWAIEGRDFVDPSRATRAVAEESTAAAILIEFLDRFDVISLRAARASAPSPLDEFLAWKAALSAQTVQPLATAYDARVLCAVYSLERFQPHWHDVIDSLHQLMQHEGIAVLWVDALKHWEPRSASCARDPEELLTMIDQCTVQLDLHAIRILERIEAQGVSAGSGVLEAGEPALRAGHSHREALLRDHAFLTSEQVAERARSAVFDSNPSQFTSRLRREGRLLGAKRGAQYLHPAFQFGDNGQALAQMRNLIPLLPTEERDGGWASVLWCFQPHADLGGQSPAEVFPDDAQRVIDVARQNAAGTSDADW